jgi:hypothetical protein
MRTLTELNQYIKEFPWFRRAENSLSIVKKFSHLNQCANEFKQFLKEARQIHMAKSFPV